MMPRFTCAVARLGPSVRPPPFLAAGGEPLARALRKHSNNNIQVDVDISHLGAPFDLIRSDGTVAVIDLHAAARRLLRNPAQHDRVDKIALLLGDRHKVAGVFGTMFDTAAAAAGSIKGLPREACAVFLGEIAAQRNPSGGDATGQQLLEELFTCVHEIGHVFNLEHINDSKNFMSQSPAGSKSLPNSAHVFAPDHELRLMRDPLPLDTWPGGSEFGSGDPNLMVVRRQRDRSRKIFDLRFRIEISRNECFHFEPVELDLRIEQPPEGRSRRSIPNEVDPGYERLRVWIETPEGACRALRPFASYCAARSRFRLSHDRPFRRDLHLTVDAAGHVFRTAGVHLIVAELWLASNAVLRSNTVEINIRPLPRLSDAGRQKRRLLERAEIAILTAHKLDRANGRAVAAVEAFLDDGPASPAKPLLRYYSGRALLERTLWTRDADEAQTLRERALGHLRGAADDATLGAHRQARCSEFIEALRA